MRKIISILFCLIVAPLAAQTVATIDSGMTREQVVAKLGEPLSAHSYQRFTYLLYKNGCEKSCGMNDLVTLDSGKVVDAVFRSSARHYSGTSSSPRMITASAARRGVPGKAPLVVPLVVPPPSPKKPE